MALTNPKHLAIAIVALAAGVGICLLAVRMYHARTYHFVEVRKNVLYRDGMRRTEQFMASCDKGHIKTVISLIGDDEIVSPRFAPAMAQCKTKGIQTLRVGIVLGGRPTTADVQKFLKLVETPANQPVLAHCREGVRRTGMMVSAYRMSVMGMTREQAKAALETFGHSRRSIGDIEEFIDAYDPQSRSIHYSQQPATTASPESE